MSHGAVDSTLFEGKRIVVTGGTGSLGKVLTRRLLSGRYGRPSKITIFSRDEAKQHTMRIAFRHLQAATEEIIYHNFEEVLEFRIGSVSDYHEVAGVLDGADVVFNAAAMKQVPTCEYFPYQAVQTNITGPENIVRCIHENKLSIGTVVAVSTDKACKPVNVMGMTKAIQERVFMNGNLRCPSTRFVGVRYGNVLASRGSVIPLFHTQIKAGGPVTITTRDMTRFLLSLEQAVDTIVAAVALGKRGEVFVPIVRSSLILNVAQALVGDRDIEVKEIGIRPGEKIHEVLIGEDEVYRTVRRGDYYAIRSILPEVDSVGADEEPARTTEYSSGENVMDLAETSALLRSNRLMLDQVGDEGDEMLR